MKFELADSGSFAIDYLLRCGIESAILVPLILLVQRLSGDRLSPTVKHGLWFVLLVRLSLPAFPESQLSLFQVAGRIQQDVFSEKRTVNLQTVQRIVPPVISQSSHTEGPNPAPAPLSKTSSPSTRELTTSSASPSLSDEPSRDPIPSFSVTRNNARGIPSLVESSADSASESWAIPWKEGSLVTWIGGMILISIRIARKSIGLHQHLQRMAPIRSPNFLKRITSIPQGAEARHETP